MNTITVKRRDCTQGPGSVCSQSDVSVHISGDARIVLNDRCIVLVKSSGCDLSKLHESASKIKYPAKAKRTNGLPVRNRSFGFTTRNVIRGDYCSAASLARELSSDHKTLCDFSEQIETIYKDNLPQMHAIHLEKSASRISPEYKLGDQEIFTSGNANRNNPVKYHFDTGNIKGVFSAMIVLRRGATGGELILPEFDIGIYLEDGDVIFFDGQSILHGVTPITLESEDSYRISLVYYTLSQMWKCLTGQKEIERIKNEKTIRERAIAGKRGYRGGKPEFRKRTDLPSR